MRTHGKKLGWLLVGLLVGCGGFDEEYACEQELDCEGTASGSNMDLCVDILEEIYDDLSDSQQEQADKAQEKCMDKKSCEYVECIELEGD